MGVEGVLPLLLDPVEAMDNMDETEEMERRWFVGKGVVKWAVSD